MADSLSIEARSRTMAGIRSRHTQPEGSICFQRMALAVIPLVSGLHEAPKRNLIPAGQPGLVAHPRRHHLRLLPFLP